ncbi:MAG: DUF2721 domain-containing protein [Gammaproteobacteria bacterium]|nr:DUF2721 domain-containing protein [Gammaproteobacteria bacterium]
MSISEIVPLLELSIAPVIVISGVGLVLLSMTNRYGRVIDRSRILADSVRMASGADVERLLEQQKIMLRLAIALESLSLLLATVLIITLFVSALFDFETVILIIALFVACMGALIAGLLVFIVDVNVSLSALRLETRAGKR